MPQLAIRGGKKVREKPFPAYRVMGNEEAQAAYDVVQSGVLSKYLGCWDPDFFGGNQVQGFEKEWAAFFNVKHAVSVNSNTSGLLCAVGALGIGPGDEVIVSPYSMSISASVPLFYGAIPVFADIEEDCFCIDPKAVEKVITERTRAILAVDIFGQPFNSDAINDIARKHGIAVIEDCAQAPAAKYGNRYAGALGNLGVFSLNYHKHIHTGEGGVIVTDDDDLAMRCRLIRNHAEAVVDGMGYKGDLTNMIGLNLRMTEIEAAIGRVQLKKLGKLIDERRENVQYLESKLTGIDFIALPKVREQCNHSYYVHALKFDSTKAGIPRNTFVEAVKAELPLTEGREDDGVLMSCGYVRPLYLQSLYQRKIGFGKRNYPFNDKANSFEIEYKKGLCPVAERMHYEVLFSHEMMRPGMSRNDMDDFTNAIFKVQENIDELR